MKLQESKKTTNIMKTIFAEHTFTKAPVFRAYEEYLQLKHQRQPSFKMAKKHLELTMREVH